MFAGVSWEGTIVTEDEESNETFYRRPISHKALLRSRNVKVPSAGLDFMRILDKIAPGAKR